MTDATSDTAGSRRRPGRPDRSGTEGGARTPKRIDRAAAAYEKAAKPFIVIVFMVAVILPIFFYLGGARMTVLRLFLLVMFVPLFFRWVTGAYGYTLADGLIFIHTLWTVVAMSQNHPFSRSLEFAGIQGVELISAYLLARVYIRNVDGFLYFVRAFLWFLVFLLPFALYESLTRTMPLSVMLSKIPGIQLLANVNYEPRMGLYRAQVSFEHPILFGVFCAVGVSLAWAALKAADLGTNTRIRWVGISFFASFLSLSTGALVAMAFQIGLFIWDFIARAVPNRWRLLILMTTFFYVVIDLLSNRTPITIFISIATFNSSSSWNRVLIWKYGSAVMWDNPVWGIGLRYWYRPLWMKASVDNFWLLTAMRYGIPAFLTLAGAFLASIIAAGRQDFSDDPRRANCQKAYIIALVSVALAGCTVHIWGNTFFFVMFLLGAGVWLYTEDTRPDARALREARAGGGSDGGSDGGDESTPEEPSGRSARRSGRMSRSDRGKAARERRTRERR